MQAGTSTQPGPSHPSAAPRDADQMRGHIVGLLLTAAEFTAPGRVEDTARGWLARSEPFFADPGGELARVADALGMALNLALFTPSASGVTAFDRLARKPARMSAGEAKMLQPLRSAQFRLLRIEAASDDDGIARVRDLASNELLDLLDESIGPETCGIPIVGWLMNAGAGKHIVACGITPLDEAGLAVATGFIRPGRPGLVNPLRCAEAVFRHVVRHGTPEIPGLNRPFDDEDDEPEAWNELDLLAEKWAEPGASREPGDIQFVRLRSNPDDVLDVLASAANTRDHGLQTLSDAYAAIAAIQLETVHRRSSIGSGAVGLDTIAAALNAAIASGALPSGARDVFDSLRRKLGRTPAANGNDAELDRLIGRIRALREKTVEQGCTEQEALAAAEKVAELLDRYGLSLSELEMSRQTCEGAAVQTDRRRAAPIDDCVPTIAGFFDCRVWAEKGPQGMLHYVFFGLPADVVAARYLYDLVEQAFETETARFRAGKTYASTPTGTRRTASNSFQIGLSRGIVAKLQTLRDARETALRHASGRDLVVAKAGLVDAELAALGLHLRTRTRSTGRRVLQDVYQQGHEAGLGFAYTPGVAYDG